MERVMVVGIRRAKEKRGQIWIETVIYTLIGLAIIGLVLAGALPKINEKRDEITIERSIEAMGIIDNKVYEASRAIGNRRIINLDIKNGVFTINPASNTITWILDSSFKYSEIGESVPFGRINITTSEDGDYEVELKLRYNMNLTYDGSNIKEKMFSAAPTPYRLVIENTGTENGKIMIEFLEA